MNGRRHVVDVGDGRTVTVVTHPDVSEVKVDRHSSDVDVTINLPDQVNAWAKQPPTFSGAINLTFHHDGVITARDVARWVVICQTVAAFHEASEFTLAGNRRLYDPHHRDDIYQWGEQTRHVADLLTAMESGYPYARRGK